MKLTDRDRRLVRDIALSHVLSRNQIIELGYFGSVTRANTRLRELVSVKCLTVHATPFFTQNLYIARKEAVAVVGERIAPLLLGRKGTPRFLQHALAVTNTRIELSKRGWTGWRFEAQLRHQFRSGGRTWEVRPDGLMKQQEKSVVLEIDLGHVSISKFEKKLQSYETFIRSNELFSIWGEKELCLMTVTVGKRRRYSLERVAKQFGALSCRFVTFDEMGVKSPGGWS